MVLIAPVGPIAVAYRLVTAPWDLTGVGELVLERPFYLAECETSVDMMKRLEGAGEATCPSAAEGRLPATGLRISRVKEGLCSNGLRLPTELEWMYAAMLVYRESGSEFLDHENLLDPSSEENINDIRGIYAEDEVGDDGFPGLSPCGALGQSGLGLYDVFGNVAELCGDHSVGALVLRRLRAKEQMVVLGGSYRSTKGEVEPGAAFCPWYEGSPELGWWEGFRAACDP